MCNELVLKADYVKDHDPVMKLAPTSNWQEFYTGRLAIGQSDRFHLWLSQLKTYLRNCMREERLSGIAILNIEKDFEINMLQIVTDFAAKKCEKHDFSKQSLFMTILKRNLFMIFQLIFNNIFCFFTAFEH